MKYKNFGEYIGAILNHIDQEYESSGLYGSLTEEEKDVIFSKLAEHYNTEDSINNASSDIVNYIRHKKYYDYEN